LGKNKNNTDAFAPGSCSCGGHPVLATLTGVKLVQQFASRFLKDESGASAAEYAVLLTLITAVLIGAVTTLGTAINAVFQKVSTTLSQAA
jgi:pilus assembly protein Flp/PilA